MITQKIDTADVSMIFNNRKVLGFENPAVAYSYSNLGLYYHTCQYFSKGFEYMNRAIKIL